MKKELFIWAVLPAIAVLISHLLVGNYTTSFFALLREWFIAFFILLSIKSIVGIRNTNKEIKQREALREVLKEHE